MVKRGERRKRLKVHIILFISGLKTIYSLMFGVPETKRKLMLPIILFNMHTFFSLFNFSRANFLHIYFFSPISVFWGYHKQGSCQAGMSAAISKVSIFYLKCCFSFICAAGILLLMQSLAWPLCNSVDFRFIQQLRRSDLREFVVFLQPTQSINSGCDCCHNANICWPLRLLHSLNTL